jgi:Ca2+-binding RTX toxin-like protein
MWSTMGDRVVENADEGIDTVQSSVTYTLSGNVENLTLTGGASINGTGNAQDNVITGNAGNNILSGLGGNDTLIAGAGADTLDGGTGDDKMDGGLGDDTYVVDATGDVVVEGAGAASTRSGQTSRTRWATIWKT